MLSKLFGGGSRQTRGRQSARVDASEQQGGDLLRSQKRALDYAQLRSDILLAGGEAFDHQPGLQDPREAAVQRLLQTGELREQIDYAAFPLPRTYRYSLTPSGERAAALLLRSGGG